MEGEGEGQQEHKSHSFIQSRISNKKHCQASMVEGLAPPTRAVADSHITICRRLRIQYVFSTHVWCKPVLYYCLLRSCKASKQHFLLHRTNTETRIIIKKTQTWVSRPINSQ